MHSPPERIVILGTGGTIAGRAASSGDNVGYRAGAISVEGLLASLPQLAGVALEAEQVAQVDSKDMSHALWQDLALRIEHHRARDDVRAVVVTHGTDTLEETGFFLHSVLAAGKPVVMTAAMRPATSLQADGPQNLLDALIVAQAPRFDGIVAVMGGRVYCAAGLRKVDGYRIDAFEAGEGGPVAVVEEGVVRWLRSCPVPLGMGLSVIAADVVRWPRVAWITSHAGFDPAMVSALVAAGFDGLVVAGTGNGSLHVELDKELQRACETGVVVRLTSRCAQGRIVGAASFECSRVAGPAQARVELLLDMLARQPASA